MRYLINLWAIFIGYENWEIFEKNHHNFVPRQIFMWWRNDIITILLNYHYFIFIMILWYLLPILRNTFIFVSLYFWFPELCVTYSNFLLIFQNFTCKLSLKSSKMRCIEYYNSLPNSWQTVIQWLYHIRP